MSRIAYLAAALAAAALLAVGCASARSAGAAHPSASARASIAITHLKALAGDPAVQAQVKKVAPKVQSCAAQNGIDLTITGAGTSAMRAKVTRVHGLTMLHPVKSIEKTFACAGLTAADLAKVESFAKATITANGFGHGSATKDFTAIVTYAAGLMTGKAS